VDKRRRYQRVVYGANNKDHAGQLGEITGPLLQSALMDDIIKKNEAMAAMKESK
jgi:hypothetical protein